MCSYISSVNDILKIGCHDLFLLNRQLMEARMIFLLQPAVKPDLDLTRPLIQMLFSYVDILSSEETHVKC